ncbi:f-box domain-containing protein [Fusarium napiforme]|uniref:F-box domain-containing protein n=1 Tax=Fusarium napiforme TaxID=42672 RepID=A0A8H5NEC7_9HYPO|nr:f-box domain-containing protein [Fusarium napiforme]
MATATRVHHLPPETLGNVMSFLPQADLKNLRLIDHRFSPLATRQLFRRTRLLARAKDNNDPQRFIQLANSELSGLVREVSCDVSSIVHNGFYYVEKKNLEPLPVFWDALPLLARFRNIQTLHLCFDANLELHDHGGSREFRKRVMKTVFCILTGTFDKEVPKTNTEALSRATIEIPHPGDLSPPMTLPTLIISNLGDYHDPELSSMPEFKAVLSRIKALRLDIAQHKGRTMRHYAETTAVPNQCQEAFTQLPLTWLSSTVGANLQALSLHYQSYWGWFPNIDIRQIGGGNGMPKLRSLALGRFVFSHQREVSWITSLDLEELFLEGCAVLAKHVGHPSTQKGLWNDGHKSPEMTEIDEEAESTHLCWHEIIRQIRTSMLNLKRFCTVTQPDLSYHFHHFKEINSHLDPEASAEEHIEHNLALYGEFANLRKKDSRSSNTAFQHFTCATSPKLCLGSDVIHCSQSGCSVDFDVHCSTSKYVSHYPTYMEQASCKSDLFAEEADPELRDMNDLAAIEIKRSLRDKPGAK